MEEYPAGNLPHNVFTVLCSQKLKGILGGLTPFVFCFAPPSLPPRLNSSGPQRRIFVPSGKGRIQQYPWIHPASIKGQEPITIAFTQTKKGSHEKYKEGGKKQIWPNKESKRHQPHTSGQCSFHSAYILALLWVREERLGWRSRQILWTFTHE